MLGEGLEARECVMFRRCSLANSAVGTPVLLCSFFRLKVRAEVAEIVKMIEAQHLQLHADVAKFDELLADAVKTCVAAAGNEENRLTGVAEDLRDQATPLLSKLQSVADRAGELRHRQDVLSLERLQNEKAGSLSEAEPREMDAIAAEVATLQTGIRSLTAEVDGTISSAVGLTREVEALRNGLASFPAPVGSQEFRQRLHDIGQMLVELQHAVAARFSNAMSQTSMAASKVQHARAADEARAAMKKRLQSGVQVSPTHTRPDVWASAPRPGALDDSDVESAEDAGIQNSD